MVDIQAATFYCFYKAYDTAVHFPARCFPETSCHFLTVLTYPQIFFAHIVAVMHPEIIQE